MGDSYAPLQLESGLRLDRYELLYPVAQGGMGAVWAARQRGSHGFEKLVALKTILPQFAKDETFRMMFLDEARIASRIEHENVARILDLGDSGGLVYLTMEWVNGDSLSKLQRILGTERFPMGVLLRTFADACAGLHAAHELVNEDGELLDLVHRDISPHNIILSTQGMAKVIDFGVAKAKERLAQETNSGSLKGKYRYMSPEQVRRKQVDRRSDLWSMGVALYHMLTGGYPIPGENDTEILVHLLSRQTLRPLPPDVPAPVVEVVRRALQIDPAARFATALDMQGALEKALGDIGERTTVRDVAVFVNARFGERQQQRQEALRIAQAALKERARVNARLGQVTSHESTSKSAERRAQAESIEFEESSTDDAAVAKTSLLAADPLLVSANGDTQIATSISSAIVAVPDFAPRRGIYTAVAGGIVAALVVATLVVVASQRVATVPHDPELSLASRAPAARDAPSSLASASAPTTVLSDVSSPPAALTTSVSSAAASVAPSAAPAPLPAVRRPSNPVTRSNASTPAPSAAHDRDIFDAINLRK